MASKEKWWLLRVKVQAETPTKAMQTLRRVSAMPQSFEDINDLGQVTMDGVAETESPWRPAETAPKTGEYFIGYDDNTEHAEVMRWDEERKQYENADHDDVDFTRWMVKPPKVEE